MMFGAKAYAQVGLESGVNSASPHKLIVMLYDGAIEAIRQAKIHTESQNIEEKIKSIDKALRIINDGLIISLDTKSGGQLAEQLMALYQFISKELVLANVKNDLEKLENCMTLLSDLRSAWNEIGSNNTSSGSATIKESL